MAEPITSVVYINSGAAYGGEGDGFEIQAGGSLFVGSAGDDQAGAGTITSGVLQAGGALTIYPEGVANDLVISGMSTKSAFYMDGGVVNGLTVVDGCSSGAIIQSGIINDLTLLGGAAQTVVMQGGGTANNVLIEAGQLRTNGGEINGITVRGGTAYLYSTKDITGAVVSGGTLALINEASVSGAVMSGGYINLSRGAIAEDTKVSGGTMRTYVVSTNAGVGGGSALGTLVDGGRLMMYGGYASGTTVVNGDLLVSSVTVSAGDVASKYAAVAYDTLVSGVNASQVIRGGEAYDTTVAEGGLQQIETNGAAYRTEVQRGASVVASAGAVLVSAAVREGGSAQIRGTEAEDLTAEAGAVIDLYGSPTFAGSNTNIAADTLYMSGSKLNTGAGSIVNGVGNGYDIDWEMRIGSGLVVSDTTVLSGGSLLLVGGKSFNTVVESGALENVLSSSVASGTVVRAGGSQYTSRGAFTYGTTVEAGGNQITRSEDFNAQIYGSQLVGNFGVAVSGTLYNGASQTLNSGGIASATEVLENATQSIADGGVARGVTLASGAVQKVAAGGASIDTVAVEGARIELSNTSAAIGGRNASIAAGTVYVNGELFTDLAIQSGVVTGIDNLTGTIGLAEIRVDGTTVGNGGSLGINNKAVGSGINVDGGILVVYSGGAIIDTSITTAGELIVSNGGVAVGMTPGTATGATTVRITGGTAYDINTAKTTGGTTATRLNVSAASGGVISGVSINYGNTYLIGASGGIVYDATIKTGFFNINGANASAYNTVLDGGQIMLRHSTAVTHDTVMNGGNFHVSGGVASGTTVNAGTMSVWATAVDTTVSGGVMNVTYLAAAMSDTPTAERTVIAGGTVSAANVDSFVATLKDTVVSAGELVVDAAGATLSGVTEIIDGSLTLNGIATAAEGASINFNIVNRNVEDKTVSVSDWTLLDSSFALNVTGAFGQAAGYYRLLGNGATFLDDGGFVTLDIGGNRRELALDNSYTDYMSGKLYTLVLNADKSNISIHVQSGQTLAAASSAGQLTVEVNNNGLYTDYGALWDDSTDFDTGSFIYAMEGNTAGNAWLEINTAKIYDAVVFGGGKSDSVDGVVNINFVSGQLTALMGGADGASYSVNGVNLNLGASASVSLVYGGGRGDVNGDVTINIASTSGTIGGVYGGSVLLTSQTDNVTISGDVTLNIIEGNFSDDIVGGGRVNGSSAGGTGTQIIDGLITVNVSGGDFLGDNSVYGGGFAVGHGIAESDIEARSGVAINWNGGEIAGATAGRGIFGGAFAADNAIANVYGVTIDVASGIVGNIFGGGWAQNGGVSNVVGDVNITVEGGSIANIYGGGAHAKEHQTALTSVSGNVNITVSGGTVEKIFAGGQVINDVVQGNATVTVSGTAQVDYLSGNGYQDAETVAGISTLVFADYAQSFGGTITGFDKVTFSGSTAMTFAGGAARVESSISSWSYVLSGAATTGVITTWESVSDTFAGDTVAVELCSGDYGLSWNLAVVDDAAAFGETTFDLYLDGNLYAADFQLGGTVVGSVFDGYSLYFDEADKTLKFASTLA